MWILKGRCRFTLVNDKKPISYDFIIYNIYIQKAHSKNLICIA